MLDNYSLRSKVALLSSGAIFAAAAVGGITYGINRSAAPDLLVTGSDEPIATEPQATVSDLKLSVDLTTDPANKLCHDWLATSGRLAAGCPLTSTITVVNNASTPATNVVVTAPHPEGWENPVVTQPTSGCSLSGPGPDLVCELGTLAPGASAQVIVQGDSSASDDTHTLSSVVTVESDGIDPTPESSAEAAILRIVPQADLSVKLTPAANLLVPGEQTTFTATVTNNGPSVAHNVRIYQAVTDPLSADFTDVAITNSGDSEATCKGEFEQNNSTARCKVVDLAPGETASMVVTGNISAAVAQAGQPVEISVGVSSDTADTDNKNNNATVSVMAAEPGSNLLIGTTGPHSVAPGERATWTMTIEDGGPSNSPNTRVDLTIPDTLTDVVVTSDHGPCTIKGCDLGRLLASVEVDMPGNTANIAITGTANGSASGETAFMLVGQVYSDTSPAPQGVEDLISQHGDGIWEAEVATDTPNITTFNVTVDPTLTPVADDEKPQADIVLSEFTITALDNTYEGPGSLRHIHFVVTNNGPDPAEYPWFRLARSTDATTDLVDYPDYVAGNAWIAKMCQTTPREIMCALTTADTMGVGESVTIDYNIALARMGRPGSYTDYLYAYSQTQDPDEANNYGQADIVTTEGRSALKVTAIALDTVANTGSPGTPGSLENPNRHQSFVAGDQFAYQITLEVPQADMADATGVTLTAEMPPGFTTTSARTASGQCDIGPTADSGQTVTCTIPVVAAVPTESSTQIILSGHVNQNANDIQFGDLDTDSWAEDVPMHVSVSSTTPTKDGSPNVATTTVHTDIVESADLELFVTPDQAGSLDPNTVGYTMFVLNLGPSGVEHAAFTAVIPEGYEFDADASTCVAPKNIEMDLDSDGAVDLAPTTPGFTVGSETAVVCNAERMRSDVFGQIEAGQAGWARIVLKRIPGATTHGGQVEIVAGSLAPDPDISNNSLAVSTTMPTRLNTLSAAHPTGADVPIKK